MTTWAWPWKSSVSARRAVQTLTACQSRFNTKTCWFNADFMARRRETSKTDPPVNAPMRFVAGLSPGAIYFPP